MLLEQPQTRLGGAEAVAALRIAAGVAGLITAWGLWGFRVPPEELRFPPPGTAWLGFLPVDQWLFNLAVGVLFVATIATAVGWRPRWSASIAAAAVFYAGWITTLTGKVDHIHHVMWALVLIAVAPSANAWAVRREERAGSYKWPIETMVILIGLAYFSAGLAKVQTSGWAWGWSDNLVNTMLAHSAEKGIDAVGWLVDYPILGKMLGSGALIFELTFLPLVLWPKTRRWVWPAGLLFHWGTWLMLDISFLHLQALYVVFLPWRTEGRSSTLPQRMVSAGLVAAVTVFSLVGVEKAWPVAAYPGFEGMHPPEATRIEVLDGGIWLPVSEHRLAEWVGRQRTYPIIVSAHLNGRSMQLAEWGEVEDFRAVTVAFSKK